MERLFVECTVRAVLLVGGTALVLFLMRAKTAAARHTVWSGVLALMLGLPIWTVWGPKVSVRLLPPLAQATASEPIGPADTLNTTLLSSYLDSNWQRFWLGVYLLGSGVLVFRLLMGTVHADKLVRKAMLRNGVRTNPLCAAPVTVGFLHPVIVFPEHWHKWSQAQLEAILTHEREHMRRRDSLVQWFALLNRALFWFHPVAWWLERKLSALAEEACDNAVIERGHNPREYAECLLDIARSVSLSGSRLNVTGMAMPGGFLPQRIRQIMEGGRAAGLSRARMACVIAAWATTCTIIAASNVDHVRPKISPPDAVTQRVTESASRPTAKFVLDDLKLEGEARDLDGVRARVLKAWRDRAYMVTRQDAKPRVAAQAEQPSPPSCRYCPNPEYPPKARKAKIPDATVLLEIVVLESGDADKHNIQVLKEDPPGDGFGDKAVAAVKNWKFNPPTKDGKPVKAKTKVEVRFRLAD